MVEEFLDVFFSVSVVTLESAGGISHDYDLVGYIDEVWGHNSNGLWLSAGGGAVVLKETYQVQV